MVFHPFEVTTPHVIYALLGGFVVLFGMFSLFLREKLYVGEACWAFVFGIAMGPYGANVFNPRGWGSEADTNVVTLELTRVVLAIGVFAIGAELPKQYMKKHWKSLFFLLVPVMTWGWLVSAGLVYALIPALNFRSSLAIAACLTPTDPILAAAVIGGNYADKHVPAHIRHLLAAESGCNDGAAFPFLFIALYLIIDTPSTGLAIKDWFLLLWLYQIVMGTFIGALVGFLFRHLMKFCEQHNLIDRHSYVAQYVSLAIFTIGITVLLGSDDLLATFACGTAFAWDGFFNRQTEESNFSSVIDLLFNIAAFIFVGAWMPFNLFNEPELTISVWRLIVIAILVLLLRRLPVMVALYKWIPDIKTFHEAVFCGHFGPIGVGAVFISTLAIEVLEDRAHDPNHQTEILIKSLQPIVAFMVLCSVTVHGLSIPSFSLGRRVHSVSRTWSRHASIGGGVLPDWTNHATLVKRGGDDIVVNRDAGDASPASERDVEKGIVGSELEGVEELEKRPTMRAMRSSASHVHKASRASREVVDLEAEKHRREEHYKEETPPDGLEVLSEWQEGSHTIIERRAGPGEEVEVEVIRHTRPHHASMSSAEGHEHRTSEFFRGERDHVHSMLSAYLTKFKHNIEHDLHEGADQVLKEGKEDVEKTAQGVKAEGKKIVQDVEEAVQRADEAVGGSLSTEKKVVGDAGAARDDEGEWTGDDEEDWASDTEEVDDVQPSHANIHHVVHPSASLPGPSTRKTRKKSKPSRKPEKSGPDDVIRSNSSSSGSSKGSTASRRAAKRRSYMRSFQSLSQATHPLASSAPAEDSAHHNRGAVHFVDGL